MKHILGILYSISLIMTGEIIMAVTLHKWSAWWLGLSIPIAVITRPEV